MKCYLKIMKPHFFLNNPNYCCEFLTVKRYNRHPICNLHRLWEDQMRRHWYETFHQAQKWWFQGNARGAFRCRCHPDRRASIKSLSLFSPASCEDGVITGKVENEWQKLESREGRTMGRGDRAESVWGEGLSILLYRLEGGAGIGCRWRPLLSFSCEDTMTPSFFSSCGDSLEEDK